MSATDYARSVATHAKRPGQPRYSVGRCARPWGWGPPPAARWSGPPPWVNPHPINYWGYNVTPVWDDGFHGWGIWLFGVWIPIIGIQGY